MSRVITLLYIRWGIVLLILFLIALSGFQRYQKEVASLTPDELFQNHPTSKVRVLGIIQGGSLTKEEDSGRAYFRLQGKGKHLPVRYHGQDTEMLRDLKIVVVTGRLDAGTGEFEGETLSIAPNYGFVAAAWLLGVLPTMLLLFLMERKLRLLFTEVKEAKLYESEVM